MNTKKTTTKRTCPITGHHLTPHQHAAPTAAHQLQQLLTTHPDILHQLEITTTRQTHMPHTGPDTPKNEQLPYNPTASQTTTKLKKLLHTTHQTLNPHTQPTSWHTTIQTINQNAHKLTTTPHGTALLQQLLTTLNQALHTIDRPPDRQYAGPCPTCHTDQTAPHGTTTTQCPKCHTQIDIPTQKNWMHQQLLTMNLPKPAALHATTLITQTPITRQNLHDWQRRGRITPRGHDKHGTPTYNIQELVNLANQKTRHPHQHTTTKTKNMRH